MRARRRRPWLTSAVPLAILRAREDGMRFGSVLMAGGLLFVASAHAQLSSSDAYPINTASPHPPFLQFDQKDRTAEVEVRVGTDGHTISTRLLTRSGSGVYDERVRGFWKEQPFVPAVDAAGHLQEATLRVRSVITWKAIHQGIDQARTSEGYHFSSEISGRGPDVMASRIERMSCHDLLWEYDFMHRLAPKAKLQHEEIFHVAFAMFIAARQLPTEARDSLIAQWDTLIAQTLDSCRAQPAAAYWKDAFVHTFEIATPVGVNVE
jgi:hypothetical protein